MTTQTFQDHDGKRYSQDFTGNAASVSTTPALLLTGTAIAARLTANTGTNDELVEATDTSAGYTIGIKYRLNIPLGLYLPDVVPTSQTMPGSNGMAALGATTKVVPTIGLPIPSTFTLRSADATRKIEFCTDGGPTEYFTPTYDVTSATQLVVTTKAGITHVKFTALSGDTWGVC